MAISFSCPHCGRGYKVPDDAGGKSSVCKACNQRITIPTPTVAATPTPAPAPVATLEPEAEDLAAKLLLSGEEPAVAANQRRHASREESNNDIRATSDDGSEPVRRGPTRPEPPTPPFRNPASKTKPKVDVHSLPPITMNTPPTWKRHLHWLLALALLPLVISLFTSYRDREVFEKRIIQTIETTDELTQDRLFAVLVDDEKSIDDFLRLCPDKKLKGALLSRDSYWPWGMALATILVYLTFITFLAWGEVAKPVHVFLVGLFTATVGVGFLLLLQAISTAAAGRVFIGKSIIALLFLILNFIAFSYAAADNPDNNFLISFVGFTLGVGLCEEIVKLIPLFIYRNDEETHWRGMFLWGLASGAGFGISEGIIYSNNMYNGLFGADTYAVRFISCVALHAIWSGSAAMFMHQQRHKYDSVESWFGLVLTTIWIVAVVAVLHGLYDTALKKDYSWLALLTAFVSFGYLAFLFSRNQNVDDAQAQQDMLREYKRRKRHMA